MKKVLISMLLLFTVNSFSQNTCEMGFLSDSLFLEKNNQYVIADNLSTPPLKNGDIMKLFMYDGKYFLSISIKENLYFDRVDNLEIFSGSKSMVLKNIKQYRKDKYTGLYVFEVYKNYIGTLKDDGITGLMFNKAVTRYYKQDVREIKKIANCFYLTVNQQSPKK